jgi:hypothetical protein
MGNPFYYKNPIGHSLVFLWFVVFVIAMAPVAALKGLWEGLRDYVEGAKAAIVDSWPY